MQGVGDLLGNDGNTCPTGATEGNQWKEPPQDGSSLVQAAKEVKKRQDRVDKQRRPQEARHAERYRARAAEEQQRVDQQKSEKAKAAADMEEAARRVQTDRAARDVVDLNAVQSS